MVKMIFVFLLFYFVFFFGIKLFRAASAMENIAFAKLVAYSSVCALFASVFLSVIVYLF